MDKLRRVLAGHEEDDEERGLTSEVRGSTTRFTQLTRACSHRVARTKRRVTRILSVPSDNQSRVLRLGVFCSVANPCLCRLAGIFFLVVSDRVLWSWIS